jgi:hypothetical protein
MLTLDTFLEQFTRLCASFGKLNANGTPPPGLGRLGDELYDAIKDNTSAAEMREAVTRAVRGAEYMPSIAAFLRLLGAVKDQSRPQQKDISPGPSVTSAFAIVATAIIMANVLYRIPPQKLAQMWDHAKPFNKPGATKAEATEVAKSIISWRTQFSERTGPLLNQMGVQ